jgi:pimeloyl-ACP methyl ester carboxylesterase
VLFVGGGPQGFHTEDEAERLAAFGDLEHVELDGAGHMVHWTRPAELADLVSGFFRRRARP